MPTIAQMRAVVALTKAGFSYEDACALRRAAMTLHSWSEMECNADVTREADGRVFVRFCTASGHITRPVRTPDRETGAQRRIAAILARYPGHTVYYQGDPRGAPVYVLPPGALKPGENADSCYSSRGIAVYG